MKNVILFIAVIILFGCKGKEKPPEVKKPITTKKEITYPRAVHNVCLNVWAVQVSGGYSDCDYYFGKPVNRGDSYLTVNAGIGTNLYERKLTDSDMAYIGEEFKFPDSISASNSYRQYLFRKNEPKRIADSIFKCQHTYQ